MTQLSHSTDVDVLTHWIEADRLRVNWEHAEAQALHWATQVVARKRTVAGETHILDRLALQEAEESLPEARQKASTLYQAWHQSLDLFLAELPVDTVVVETPPQLNKKPGRKWCKA